MKRSPSVLVLGLSAMLLLVILAAGCGHPDETGAPLQLQCPDAGVAPLGASASAVSRIAPSPSASPSVDWSEVKRIDALKDRARSIDEVLFLARSHQVLAQQEPAIWLREARETPAAAADPTALRRLWMAIATPDQTIEAANAAARWPTHHGADILYARIADPPPGSQPLLDDLLATTEVHDGASPALQVVLDLRNARTCFERREVLPQAVAHGDVRAADLLKPLTDRTGCGADESDDCFACMRTDDWLTRAIDKANERAAPTPWIVSRPSSK